MGLPSFFLHGLEVLWLGSQNWEPFGCIVRRVIDRYFRYPCYCKTNACLVFMIYDLANLIYGLYGVDQIRSARFFFGGKFGMRVFPIYTFGLPPEKKGQSSGVDTLATETTAKITELLRVDSITHYILPMWIGITGKFCPTCSGKGNRLIELLRFPISTYFLWLRQQSLEFLFSASGSQKIIPRCNLRPLYEWRKII